MAELTPEEQKRIYEEERARIEAHQSIEAEQSKRKISGLGIATLVLLVIVIVAIFLYYATLSNQLRAKVTTKTIASTAIKEPPPPAISANFAVRIKSFKNDNQGNYVALGEVTNTSTKPYRFVQIQAKFLDKQYAVIRADTTYACADDELLPGKAKPFKFSGENHPEYCWARAIVFSASEVR